MNIMHPLHRVYTRKCYIQPSASTEPYKKIEKPVCPKGLILSHSINDQQRDSIEVKLVPTISARIARGGSTHRC